VNSTTKKLKQLLIPGFIYVFFKGLRLIYSKKSYLVTTGFIDTYRTGIPCNASGNPIPWMNYNVILFLENRLNKNLTLFEFGSGYSTIFYASLVNSVTSVEYDQQWLQRIQSMAPDNVDLLFQDKDIDGDYCRTILRQGNKYDVVIVDGRDRVNCAKQAFQAISDNGIIILDDSHRNKYQTAFDFFNEKGFRHIDFEGLKPRGIGNYRTTIFYRDKNCFDI
jgi:hypothetical protein